MLDWQLTQLKAAGIEEAVLVTGFYADKVEAQAARHTGITVRCIYNPFYNIADNLGSVWLALPEMQQGPFILMNGDTMFVQDVARRLVKNPAGDISLTIARKPAYDDDDMKVIEDDGKLRAVGKKLALASINAESIGMMGFTQTGGDQFRMAVDNAIRSQNGLSQYYLAVLDQMAQQGLVHTIEAGQDEWCEIDFPPDLEAAGQQVAEWMAREDQRTDSRGVA
jgi:choline kinase